MPNLPLGCSAYPVATSVGTIPRMCGRVTVINIDGVEQTIYAWTRKFLPEHWTARYNLGPNEADRETKEPVENMPIVLVDDTLGDRVLQLAFWELIPPYLAS